MIEVENEFEKYIERCPFCGMAAGIKGHCFPGYWGPETPGLYIGCDYCWCKTDPIATHKWEPGKGTYSIEDEVKRELRAKWNKREWRC